MWIYKKNIIMKSEYKFKEKYNPNSNRLWNYDYSSNWGYFITICTKDREEYFWEIIDWKMFLNDYGKIIFNEIIEIGNYNERAFLDEFIVMPNHVHLIILIQNCVNWSCRDNSWIISTEKSTTRRNMIIPKIIWKFKMLTSKKINILRRSVWNKSWQPNYYDRIIRNQDELDRIRKYILENPLKWELESGKDNPENIFM